MGERKVLQHYYPADFDPSLLPRPKKKKLAQKPVRMALPVRAVQCITCKHYIYGGTRFNARIETVQNESYLGVTIFRLYFKCPNCKGEITIKTDPKTADYEVEHGAVRGFEPWRDPNKKNGDDDEEEGKVGHQTGANDKYEDLERRQEAMKRQLDILDALDEMIGQNKRREQVTSESMFAHLERKRKREEEKEKEIEERKRNVNKRRFATYLPLEFEKEGVNETSRNEVAMTTTNSTRPSASPNGPPKAKKAKKWPTPTFQLQKKYNDTTNVALVPYED